MKSMNPHETVRQLSCQFFVHRRHRNHGTWLKFLTMKGFELHEALLQPCCKILAIGFECWILAIDKSSCLRWSGVVVCWMPEGCDK